jgi:hypothetical protein
MLPKGVVEVDVRVDDVGDPQVARQGSHRRDDLAALERGGAGVHHDGTVPAEHETDVDVPLRIPRHEHSIGYLDER